MLREFGHFSPDVLDIIRSASEIIPDRSGTNDKIRESSHVKCWPLFIHEPLPRWFNGRLVIIGDAAHPVGEREQDLLWTLILILL